MARRLIQGGDGDAALLYIAVLRNRGGVDDQQLRAQLGWDEVRFRRSLDVLVRQGLVSLPRRGAAEKAEAPKPADAKKAKSGVTTVKVVKKSEIEQFVTRLLESKNEDDCALEWVLSKIVQAFPQFEVKDYGVKKSYEFFDRKKFKLAQTSNANWVISLK